MNVDTNHDSTVTSPTLKDCDVVCGRGGLANKHSGNILLRRICCENKKLYQASNNPTHKQCLILSIVMAIQQNGGRFVVRTKAGWEEIADKKAKEKTAQLLRESEAPIKPRVLPVPRPVVKKDRYHQRRRQMFGGSSDGADRPVQTAQAARPFPRPMLIPPEPLPADAQHRIPVPCRSSSSGVGVGGNDDFAGFWMTEDLLPALLPALPGSSPSVPPPTRAPPARPFDDDDLFDVIPLNAAHDGIESNPDFQSMCSGLVSALSV